MIGRWLKAVALGCAVFLAGGEPPVPRARQTGRAPLGQGPLQRAPRRLLIGRPEDRTYCKIVISGDCRHLDLVARNIWTLRRNFAVWQHDYERYSRQMPLRTNWATFEGRRER
jgi:hypothetical protein